MRLHLELARRSFAQTLAYRGAALAGIFTNGIFGIMIASVFLALYQSQSGDDAVQGWTRDQTITLVWINQSMLMTVYLWGWWEVTRNIQSGAIVTELLKPYDYFTYWLSRDLGRALAHFLIRGLPTFLIGAIAFDILAPASWARGIAFLLSVLLAVIVSFCLRFIANVLGFWVLDYRGIAAMFAAVMNVLSGMLAPLAFLPEPVRIVANALPFRAVIMTPNEVYLGQVAVWQGLGFQVLWIPYWSSAHDG
ncbi:MAG: ABC-2 family transporter protein [Chloroflexia bacterium]|nr:ABC-2 family transporter protein [Chloroflexia bacterium]